MKKRDTENYIGYHKNAAYTFFICMFFYLISILTVSFPLYARGNQEPLQVEPSISNPEEKLSEWYEVDKSASRYQSVYSEIENILLTAEDAGLPVGLIMLKLKEGADKGIPPERLAAALQKEKQRLSAADTILSPFKEMLSEDTLISGYKRISVYLRAGIPKHVISQSLSITREKDYEIVRVYKALDTLAELLSLSGIPDNMQSKLVKSLIISDIPDKGFTSLPSLFLKSRARGMGDIEIIQLITNVLGQGTGLLRLEEELTQRRRM